MYLKVEKGWHSTYNWSWKSQMFTRQSRGRGQLSKKDWGGETGNSGSTSQQNFPLASQAPSPFLSTHGCIIWERVTELKILDISKQSIRGRSWFSISPALDMITTNMGGVLLFTWLTECCRKREKKLLPCEFYRVTWNCFSVLNHFHSPKLHYSSAVPKF